MYNRLQAFFAQCGRDDPPSTGLPGYPRFEYERTDRINNFLLGSRATIRTGGYRLFISTPRGMKLDTFNYWPSRQYSERMLGGVTERVGNWAYVRD